MSKFKKDSGAEVLCDLRQGDVVNAEAFDDLQLRETVGVELVRAVPDHPIAQLIHKLTTVKVSDDEFAATVAAMEKTHEYRPPCWSDIGAWMRSIQKILN